MSLSILGISDDMDAHVRYAVAGITAEQLAYKVNTINRSLEELREKAPHVFRHTIGVTWTGGNVVSAAVTNGSSDLDLGAPGCTIMIDGDQTYNERAKAASTGNLLYPYTGTTGTKSVTVYGDSVILDSTVDRILGAALLEDRSPLNVINSRAEWEYWQGLFWTMRDYGSLTTQSPRIRLPGVPRSVWLETVYDNNTIQYRARCAPLPNGTWRASIDVQTMAAEVTAADLSGEDGVTITGALTPDVTGFYAVIGTDSHGYSIYARQVTDLGLMILFREAGVDPPKWYLNLFDNSNVWTGGSTVDGSYTAATDADGTATAALSAQPVTRPVPGARVYGILRAICLYHWSGSPWFRNDAARPHINEEYKQAALQLEGFRPNTAEPVQMTVRY